MKEPYHWAYAASLAKSTDEPTTSFCAGADWAVEYKIKKHNLRYALTLLGFLITTAVAMWQGARYGIDLGIAFEIQCGVYGTETPRCQKYAAEVQWFRLHTSSHPTGVEEGQGIGP